VNKRGLPEAIRMKHDLHYVEELFHDESGIVGRFLPIDSIQPNPNQPRHVIGDLTELTASIKEKGVLEPLLVRRFGDGYQIIAGERRWRACKALGLSLVPCIEKDVDDRETLEIALIENLQRKDLSSFEEAEGLQALVHKFNYTHSQIAQVIGKSRSSVTETLSLNQMPIEVKDLCRRADITSKSLLLQVVRQPDLQSMKKLVERILKEDLTREQVRQERENPRTAKGKSFIFHAKGKEYKLIIHFNKSNVTHDDIKQALSDTLNNIK
jgi:ParB family transcriptional regulator, chromosome partitioning protein